MPAMDTTEHTLERVAALCADGHPDEAETLCRQLLGHEPENAEAVRRLAHLLHRRRQYLEAAVSFQRCVSLGGMPSSAPDWQAFAETLIALGVWDGAEAAVRHAITAAGADTRSEAESWSLMARLLIASDRVDLGMAAARKAWSLAPERPATYRGVVLGLLAQRDLAQAEAMCGQLLARCPQDAEGMALLGMVRFHQERAEEVLRLADLALVIDPSLPEALVLRAQVRLSEGRVAEALADAAAAVQTKPGLTSAHLVLASAQRQSGRQEEAEAACRRALVLRPRAAEAYGTLGGVLRDMHRLEEAEAAFKAALVLRPEMTAVHDNLAQVFFLQGRLAEGEAGFRRAMQLAPDNPAITSNLVTCLNYDPAVDEAALFAEHRAWDSRHGGKDGAIPAVPHDNPRDPEKRLRVGYVSADLARHPVGFFLEGVLAAHDPAQVEVFCYSSRVVEDWLSEKLKASAHVWRSVSPLGHAALTRRIRDDGIDILVDLSGHTGGNRLPVFAAKPAPVQASWLGYFNTTGLSAMDYVLMDAITVPDGGERWFAEEVVRLPGGRFCYTPPPYAPPPAPPPCLKRGSVTFGSFNNLSKVTDAVVGLWARVLHAVPGSRLVLKWRTLGQPSAVEDMRRRFAAEGIEASRLDLRAESLHEAMLAEYADLDIALDPFPFCGGLTTCEALWMGVPVVTLPQARPVSRQTLGFLTTIGLGGLAAATPDDYVAIAASLAADPARLADLRAGLRDRMRASPLCDAPRFTRDLEAAYRRMWRRWCSGETP